MLLVAQSTKQAPGRSESLLVHRCTLSLHCSRLLVFVVFVCKHSHSTAFDVITFELVTVNPKTPIIKYKHSHKQTIFVHELNDKKIRKIGYTLNALAIE